jgi:hypothetical protein
MKYNICPLIVAVLTVFMVATPFVLGSSIQSDKNGVVTSVIDGSTFTVDTGETIRLAEIITPNSSQPGFESSRSYLGSMIQGKTVILDVDTRIVSDQGKLLCIAYLDYNSTYYENINKAMIENGYAAPTSVSTTEFNPSTWTWFVSKQTTTPTPTAQTTVAPTMSPTPTPFSGPTPSITPDISRPSSTATTLIQNDGISIQTLTIIAIIVIASVVSIIVVALQRKK